MKGALVLALLMLAACTQVPLRDGLRDQNVSISSTTRLDLDRFVGDWHVVFNGYVSSGGPVLNASSAPFRIEKIGLDRFQASYPRGHHIDAFNWSGGELGRFRAKSKNNELDVWVLWIDEDHRTAVLGNPAGSFAQILNRTPTLRADRLQAAQEILQFNGYDLSQLRMVPQ